MKLDSFLEKLIQKQDLRLEESEKLFTALFSSAITLREAKTFLLLLAAKGESVSEILGCVKALRRLEPPYKTKLKGLVDTCGTGGDSSFSVNISTYAAFIIAGAGGKVAKHGNRAMSSMCGSSDVLEKLGLKIEAGKHSILRSIEKNNFGYFHAPAHHPVFSKVQPLRRSLKVRTLFNLLGPLINPVNPEYRLVGVSSEKTFDIYAAILSKLKANAIVCYSQDGLDEISVTGPTKIAVIEKGRVRLAKIRPEKLGISKVSLGKIRGGTAGKNASIALKLLKGRLKGPVREMACLNAAAGLLIMGKARSLSHGLRLAYDSLDSGKALKALKGAVQTQK